MRRQSGESEQEVTTSAPSTQGQGANTAVTQQPARLYPDLPRQQPNVAFLPPFGARPFPPGNGQAPFVPFGFQRPNNGLNDFRQLQPMRPMSAVERMQSQTFVDGLGRRLLSMLGVDLQKNATDVNLADAGNSPDSRAQTAPMNGDELMKALRNSSVLQQLNSGVHSVYGSLSRMYNSTIQQQLNLLQERFKRESENSTTPWQQMMAERVPQFFKVMAMRVEDAQRNMNRILRQVTMASNGSMPNISSTTSTPFFSNSMDQFMGPGEQGGNFFSRLGRRFGMEGEQNMMNPYGRPDYGGQLMEFWHNQVQPQIAMVGRQIGGVWRELTSSGALMPQSTSRARNTGTSEAGQTEKPSGDIVDSVLKEVEASGPEYLLVQPSGSDQQVDGGATPVGLQPGRPNQISPQLQNRLIAMQRDLNQLWNGLSNSLQNALTNVRRTMNPRGNSFIPLESQASTENMHAQDPAENEISDRIKDLNKIQRDADNVYNTVQQQQQTQMQRPNLADRFMNLFNNRDIDQFQERIGNTVNRFGNMVGDLWNQIPERWDNFMQQNRRPQATLDSAVATRQTASSTTQKPSSPETS